VCCYGLAAYFAVARPSNRRARVIALATHENAQHQVARIASWIGAADCGWVRTGASAAMFPVDVAAALALLRSGRDLVRAFRVIRTVNTRYGFLVSCRTACALAWYARGKTLLGAHRPGAVLVSSDSNPEEVGFVAAARALAIPQVFVSHAYPTPYSPPLDFTLSILEGEAAFEACWRKGPIAGHVLLAGIDGESAPLDPRRFERPNPVIGIFTPKALSWPRLALVIEDCCRYFRARQVVVRWHPSMLEPPRLGRSVGDLSGIVECPAGASLVETARQCDWVVADENSNVHLPVLKLGIPTIAVRNLGLYPESRSDLYGFIAAGIVFPAVERIRDVQPDVLAAFFSDCWTARFRRYDASYLRPAEPIGAEVRRAVWNLLEHPVSTACLT